MIILKFKQVDIATISLRSKTWILCHAKTLISGRIPQNWWWRSILEFDRDFI